MGRCRVTQIRQETINHPDCPIIYLATFGKGLFRSTKSIDDNANYNFCNTALPTYVNIQDLGLDDLIDNVDLLIQPNPMQSVTKLSFKLLQNSNTLIAIYNLNGKKVQDYNLGNLIAGEHHININRENLTAGKYLVMLSANGKTKIGKLVVK